MLPSHIPQLVHLELPELQSTLNLQQVSDLLVQLDISLQVLELQLPPVLNVLQTL
jgi:hypothetical protein